MYHFCDQTHWFAVKSWDNISINGFSVFINSDYFSHLYSECTLESKPPTTDSEYSFQYSTIVLKIHDFWIVKNAHCEDVFDLQFPVA